MLWAELGSLTVAMAAGLRWPWPPLWGEGSGAGREGVPEATPRSQGIGGRCE